MPRNMTRTEKIERLDKYRHYLYSALFAKVPELVKDPDNATKSDIMIYNQIIAEEAAKENNETFKKRFSF